MEIFSFVYAIIGLGFLVFVHELGHLLLARMGGIGVEAFSLFFGRAIFSFDWKGINWRIGWIPFGGYCKMKGQEDFGEAEVTADPDDFYNRPAWARFIAVLGGPLFNIILGIVMFIGIAYLMPSDIRPNWTIIVPPQYENEMQLKTGDKIIAVDGKKVDSWNDVEKAIQLDGIHKESQLITVERDGKSMDVTYAFDKEKKIRNREMGFTLPQLVFVGNIATDDMVVDKDDKGNEIKKTPPAKDSGMKAGDIILAVDGQLVRNSRELVHRVNSGDSGNLSFTVLQTNLKPGFIVQSIGDKVIKNHDELKGIIFDLADGEKVQIKVKTKEKELVVSAEKKTISISPIVIKNGDKENRIVGINMYERYLPAIFANVTTPDYSILEAASLGLSRAWSMMALSINQFKLLTQLEAETVRENMAGPLKIMAVLKETGSRSTEAYIHLIALLSIFLGIFNLLPIPAVDGGHLVITLFEMVRRKPLSMKVIQRIQLVGVFIVISLAVLVTFNDIYNLIFK